MRFTLDIEIVGSFSLKVSQSLISAIATLEEAQSTPAVHCMNYSAVNGFMLLIAASDW